MYFSPQQFKPVVYVCVSDQDGAEPSANSVSASNLLRLSQYTGRKEWLQKSQQLLAAFSDRLTRVPIALPEMVRALMAQHYTLKQVNEPSLIDGYPAYWSYFLVFTPAFHVETIPPRGLLLMTEEGDVDCPHHFSVMSPESQLSLVSGRVYPGVCRNSFSLSAYCKLFLLTWQMVRACSMELLPMNNNWTKQCAAAEQRAEGKAVYTKNICICRRWMKLHQQATARPQGSGSFSTTLI